MAEKKKKPSSKDLLELQSLYQALESDVGIGQVDEKLLQKFEQGELSKADAEKLQTEMKDVMAKRPSPPAPMQFRKEYPSSGTQYESKETGFVLKNQIPQERALAIRPPEKTGLPATLGPREIATQARIIPEAKPGALVPVEKAGALAVRDLEQVAAKNPVLKRIMLPALVLTGGAAALYGMDSDKKLDVVPSPSTPEPTPAPGPVAPAPAAPKAEEPKIIKAKSIDFNKLQKSLEQFNTQYEQDRKLAPEVEQAFATRQTALQSALADAKSAFEKSLAQAKTEADRRDTITQWASIAESLGHAMVKYFAASTGARTGQLLGSKLQLQKYDWQKDLDRSLERLKADTAEAKTMFGIAKEDIEAQAKQLGEERKTALGEREDIARQRAKTSEALLMEKARAGQRAEEDYASAYNRFLMEQAQEKRAAAREAEKEQKAITKQETKTAGEITDATKKALDAFTTGFGTSADRRANYRGDMEKELFTLGATEAEIKRLNELLDHTYTQFDETDKAEARALINSISQRKLKGAPTGPAQAAGQSDIVVVKLKDGRQGEIPRDQLDAFLKANPGAQVSP